jgi:S1-C subfamily serine protease
VWDKLTAISGLISGVAVAGIGFYATNIYNRRQTAAEEARKAAEEGRKDREIQFAEAQTVEKFIEHLASADEQRRKAALIAISTLGNSKVAIDLAEAFKGPGATSALTTIAATAPPAQAERAVLALQDILRDLSGRVVTVETHTKKGDLIGMANGLLVDADGLVVTAGHVLNAASGVKGATFRIGLSQGASSPAKVVRRDEALDLGLLRIGETQALPPLDRTPSDAAFGERVVVVWVDPANGYDSAPVLEVGRFAETGVLGGDGGASYAGVIVRVNAAPGMSGAPAVDSAGRLLGLVQASDQQGLTVLIPAEDVFAFAAKA